MHIRRQPASLRSRVVTGLGCRCRTVSALSPGWPGVAGCFGVGGPAGVQHQHRHASGDQQAAEGRPVSELLIRRVTGVLEDQVPVLPARTGPATEIPYRSGDTPTPPLPPPLPYR